MYTITIPYWVITAFAVLLSIYTAVFIIDRILALILWITRAGSRPTQSENIKFSERKR